jgi:hypothetical protein
LAASNGGSFSSQPARFTKWPASWLAIVALAAVAGFAVLDCSARQQQKNIPPEMRWRIAVGLGPTWDREQYLTAIFSKRKLEGMSRTEVLKLLGQPGYSAIVYPGNTRIDEYRLSAKNDRSYRIDYELDSKNIYDDRAHGDYIESSACSCPACATDAPAVPIATLQKTGLLNLKRDATVPANLRMSTLEKQLGRGKVQSSRDVTGGMVWFNYSETWRVNHNDADGSPNQFFIADGHVPWRDAPNDEISGQPTGGWSVVSFAPECLPQ